MGIIFITHNLGVVADICDKVSVMYAGKIVEQGPVDDIFYKPAHPYTKGLLRSMPRVDAESPMRRLIPIEGSPVDMLNPPEGCPFAPRCEHCMKICLKKMPPYVESGRETSFCLLASCSGAFMQQGGEDKWQKNEKLLEITEFTKIFSDKWCKGTGAYRPYRMFHFAINKGETLRSGRRVRMWKNDTWKNDSYGCMSQPAEKLFMMAEVLYMIIHVKSRRQHRLEKQKSVKMLPYRRKMQIIFQDPSASLDPRMTVGEIIGEAIDIHKLSLQQKRSCMI